jgi:cation:H+ antiporter
MEIFNTLVLFLIGFFILIKGANWLVSGARSVAAVFNISPWFIGLVIVGIGTSIPEFSINIASVWNGNLIGLETIIGSNTFNILVIIGLSAILSPVVLRRVWVLRDLTFNILAIVAAALVIIFPIAGDPSWVGVTRPEALALAVLFLAWIVFMFHRHDTADDSVDYEVFSGFVSFMLIAVGIVGVFFGGRWVVDGAESIALLLGISPALVALTVVAIGTSLPELTVSITAFVRRQGSIAVSNVIGSNIFDFLGIIGITALMRPIPVVGSLQFDIFAALIAALALFCAMYVIGKRYTLSRFEGALLLSVYLLYLAVIFWRG